jgi:hypothetical protein
VIGGVPLGAVVFPDVDGVRQVDAYLLWLYPRLLVSYETWKLSKVRSRTSTNRGLKVPFMPSGGLFADIVKEQS